MNQPETGGKWGYPKLNGLSEAITNSDNGAPLESPFRNPAGNPAFRVGSPTAVRKSTFEELMKMKADENALEQLDKVAMFFNSQMPSQNTGESIYRTLPNSPLLPLVSSTPTPLGRSFGPVLDSAEAMTLRDTFAARTVCQTLLLFFEFS